MDENKKIIKTGKTRKFKKKEKIDKEKIINYLDRKINNFIKENYTYKDAIQKIIDNIMDKCTYIDGESLKRHNWGEEPVELENIPKNINQKNDEPLIKALEDEIVKSIIEILWGDVQSGKTEHALNIIWFSIYVLKRPVLYIFRNLKIDKKQLFDNIKGTDSHNFNMKNIKKVFYEFNDDIRKEFGENEKNDDEYGYWKNFRIPEFKDITKDNIDKLSNRDSFNTDDIFCCLANETKLNKINDQFTKYINKYKKLVNITVLVDEGDLMSPTCSNDRTHKNDEKDTTKTEKLLSRIYTKVRYVLLITGTAHTLLYNTTTRLTDDIYVQLSVSKVHKMKIPINYYGITNEKLTINCKDIKPFWEKSKKSYNICEDYNINIKKVIQKIINRENVRYNSLLISEEKNKLNQFKLLYKIINDFKLFVIIYHEKCLRLYFPQEYKDKINDVSHYDYRISKEINGSDRLYIDKGGVKCDPKICEENSDYLYFVLDTKQINIKMVYKIISILFNNSKYNNDISNKTIVTITGKYAERGYSFTSDNYDKYSFHLTDQYFVSHSDVNCTVVNQGLRIQGKYDDEELKNGEMKLTLWTTHKLKEIIVFNNAFLGNHEFQKQLMEKNKQHEIAELIENRIIDRTYKEGIDKYMDIRKKNKNINSEEHTYNTDLTTIAQNIDINKSEKAILKDLYDCNLLNIDNYSKIPFINEIKKTSKKKFLEEYGVYKYDVSFEEFNNKNLLETFLRDENFESIKVKVPDSKNGFIINSSLGKKKKEIWEYEKYKKVVEGLHGGSNLSFKTNEKYKIGEKKCRIYYLYKDINDPTTLIYLVRIVEYRGKNEMPSENLENDKNTKTKKLDKYFKNTMWHPNPKNDNEILYQVIKDEYKNNKPNVYYVLEPNGSIYYYNNGNGCVSASLKRNTKLKK